jgi:hypothetical protein
MNTQTIWEYRVETIGSTFRSISDEDVETLLDEWGQDGWEVVAFHPIQGSNKITIAAKRQPDTARRRNSNLGQW